MRLSFFYIQIKLLVSSTVTDIPTIKYSPYQTVTSFIIPSIVIQQFFQANIQNFRYSHQFNINNKTFSCFYSLNGIFIYI